MSFYEGIRNRFTTLVQIHELKHEEVTMLDARPLSADEAIGLYTTRKDFPLMKGKELMIEAVFQEAKGHAYTDMPGNFSGSVEDVLFLSLSDNFEGVLFVAALNAVMRHLELISHTVHCRDKEIEICASELHSRTIIQIEQTCDFLRRDNSRHCRTEWLRKILPLFPLIPQFFQYAAKTCPAAPGARGNGSRHKRILMKANEGPCVVMFK
jgi:hypothetical protein